MTSDSTPASGETEAKGIEPFLNAICPHAWLLASALGLTLLMAIFSAVSALLVPPSMAAYHISVLTLVINGVLAVVLAPLLYLCRRHNYR
jgi:hypothetical protein